MPLCNIMGFGTHISNDLRYTLSFHTVEQSGAPQRCAEPSSEHRAKRFLSGRPIVHCCIVAHHWARLILLCGKIMGWKIECNTGVWLTLKGISAHIQTCVIVKDKSFESFKNSFIGLIWNYALNYECLWYDKYSTSPSSLQLDAYLLANHSDLESKIQSVPLWFN